ncbi:MAG: endosialidase [Lachnospiraceae bacterium]
MVVKELIRVEEDATLSFGNYELAEKTKKSDVEFQGDFYKIKTYNEITKLEKNGTFVYESVPGTSVHHFSVAGNEITFEVEAAEDAQITLGLEAEQEYKVMVDGVHLGKIKTNLGGKLPISVECNSEKPVSVRVEKLV